MGSISLLIGNQVFLNLPIFILRYCAEPFLETICRNSPRIPKFRNIFGKCKNPGSLTGAQLGRLGDYFGPHAPKNWAPVSEPGFLHFPQMFRKFRILGEFLKMVSKNGSAQYRRIIVGRLQQTWFPIRRLMEAKNKPSTFE